MKKAAALKLPLGEGQEMEVLEPPRKPSSWAACIKRIYEVDPLECPKFTFPPILFPAQINTSFSRDV